MRVDPFWNNVPLLVTALGDARHNYTVTQGTVDVGLDILTLPNNNFISAMDFASGPPARSGTTGNDGTQLRIASTDDFTLGSGDFTIEAWASCTSICIPQDNYGSSGYFTPHPIIERSNGTAQGSYALQFLGYRVEAGPFDEPEYAISFYCGDYDASNAMLEYKFPEASPGDLMSALPYGYVHYAVTRNGNEFTLWAAGMPVDRLALSSPPTILSPSGAGASIRIGNSILETDSGGNVQNSTLSGVIPALVGVPAHGRAFDGLIDQVRITKGYARYTRGWVGGTLNEDFQELVMDSLIPTPMPADPSPAPEPFPTLDDPGDYSSEVYRGATGAQGASATGEPQAGEPGQGKQSISIQLPDPPAQYDQRDQNETRRVIMDAMRRAAN